MESIVETKASSILQFIRGFGTISISLYRGG